MRYTRYNYKKNKNNGIGKFILSFIGMSVFVVIVGVLLANIIIYFLPQNNINSPGNNAAIEQSDISNQNATEVNSNGVDTGDTEVSAEVSNENQSNSNTVSVINTSFVAVQCGYFAKEENAKEVFNKISSGYGAFIYNDADKFKVLAGVYTAEEGEDIINRLKASGIDCAKTDFNFNTSDAVQNQIAGIYDGYLDILETAFKDDVKFVNTEEFKAWVNELENLTEGDRIEVLNEIKNHINGIPQEIKKENVAGEMEYLYGILLNFN